MLSIALGYGLLSRSGLHTGLHTLYVHWQSKSSCFIQLLSFYFYFFLPFLFLQLGQSDIDLHHSLANLVGVILGCPSNSNHLWYHLFSPRELSGTYMTGFMV